MTIGTQRRPRRHRYEWHAYVYEAWVPGHGHAYASPWPRRHGHASMKLQSSREFAARNPIKVNTARCQRRPSPVNRLKSAPARCFAGLDGPTAAPRHRVTRHCRRRGAAMASHSTPACLPTTARTMDAAVALTTPRSPGPWPPAQRETVVHACCACPHCCWNRI